MIVEQIIFTLISFAIFIYMFFIMIKNNDTSYTIILVLEAIGITLNFTEVLFNIKLNILFVIIKYVFAIIIPIGVMIIEKRNMKLFEILNITKAKIYIMLGDTKRAKKALLYILDKNPNNYNAHRLLAEIYEKEGGMRKAIDEYVQAIDLNKQDYDSYYKVANLLNQLNKKNEASEMLFNLLNKRPQMYEATILLGEILLENEMYKEAANIYQNALKYNPESFDLNYNLGIAYTMLNDFQSAKMFYEKSAEINSLVYNTKYSLAEIALIYKDLEEAKQRFLEAIEDDELSADCYYELSKIYLIKGDKDTALKYINIAIDIDSKKIVEKIKKDDIFIPIMAKISIPFNLENGQENSKKRLKEKEVKSKIHLEEMAAIARNLSYQDIKLLKKDIEGKQIKTNQQERYQKEIQD